MDDHFDSTPPDSDQNSDEMPMARSNSFNAESDDNTRELLFENTTVEATPPESSSETMETSVEDSESEQPMIRIRSDLFIDEIDEKTKELLAEIKIKSPKIVDALQVSINKYNEVYENCESSSSSDLSQQLNVFREMRDTTLKSFYVLDALDSKIRAEDVFNYGLPSDLQLEQYKQIPVEEMAEYFLRLLNVTCYLREKDFQNWKSNLMILHYRISRVLKYYAISKIPRQTDGNFMNIVKAIETKMTTCNIPIREVISLWDHLKSFSDPIDEPAILVEHAFVGVKGFGGLVETIANNAAELRKRQASLSTSTESPSQEQQTIDSYLSSRIFQQPDQNASNPQQLVPVPLVQTTVQPQLTASNLQQTETLPPPAYHQQQQSASNQVRIPTPAPNQYQQPQQQQTISSLYRQQQTPSPFQQQQQQQQQIAVPFSQPSSGTYQTSQVSYQRQQVSGQSSMAYQQQDFRQMSVVSQHQQSQPVQYQQQQQSRQGTPQTLQYQQVRQGTPQTVQQQQQSRQGTPTPQPIQHQNSRQNTPQPVPYQLPWQVTPQTLQYQQVRQEGTPQTVQQQQQSRQGTPTPQQIQYQLQRQVTPQQIQKPRQVAPQTVQYQQPRSVTPQLVQYQQGTGGPVISYQQQQQLRELQQQKQLLAQQAQILQQQQMLHQQQRQLSVQATQTTIQLHYEQSQ